jgi:RecB family endonuclease NucS
MRIIIARASARYAGRIDAELGLGDVCILIRDYESGGDGSVLVMDLEKGLGPRNWMPAGSITESTAAGLRIEHPGRGELLEIFIATIWSEQGASCQLRGDLRKLGAEREFSDVLATRLEMLGQGLHLVGREARTSAGPVDLLLTDAQQQPILVEVKRRRVTLADCYQLRRYLHALAASDQWHDHTLRGLLVGPVLAKNAKLLIDADEQLTFIRLSYHDLIASPPPASS